MSKSYDVIVLGAGAMGSAAAYYLSLMKLKVLLIEQFETDHQRGSSYGYSRIIRYAYPEADYVRLMQVAYPLWHELEAAAGETLYTRTGGLDFGPATSADLQRTIQTLADRGIRHEVLDPQEVKHRFPQFNIPAEMVTLYQEDSGILAASQCVRAHIRLAMQHGAIVMDNTPVHSIDVQADVVRVTTAQDTFEAASLVIAAGAWTNDMLAHLGIQLPLTPTRCQLVFFDEHSEPFQAPQMPVFISHFGTPQVYGIGGINHSGLKVAYHGGQGVRHVSEINYTPDEEPVESLRSYMGEYMRAASTKLKASRICLYTMTPDEDFVIDQHPDYANVSIAAGFSGHGFKFSTLIGKILAELATDRQTVHDVGRFRSARFGEIAF